MCTGGTKSEGQDVKDRNTALLIKNIYGAFIHCSNDHDDDSIFGFAKV